MNHAYLVAEVRPWDGFPDPRALDRGHTPAAPRTGDDTFATSFAANVPNNFRVFNEPDIVPKVPPLYAQLGPGYEIDSKTGTAIKHSILCYHSLASYLRVLNPQSTFSLSSDCATGKI